VSRANGSSLPAQPPPLPTPGTLGIKALNCKLKYLVKEGSDTGTKQLFYTLPWKISHLISLDFISFRWISFDHS